jgi:large subunit ribosomal protein L18
MTKATGPLFKVRFRRRREGKTDYSRRLALLKSGVPRLVVRKTNKFVIIQITEFAENGDKTIATVTTKKLADFGFAGKSNTSSAYLAGLLCGLKAKAKGVKKVVLDVGLHSASKGSLLYSALKGAMDAGLESSIGGDKAPSQERIEGKHLKSASEFSSAKQKILDSGGNAG